MKKIRSIALGLLLLSSPLFATPEKFDIFGVDEHLKQTIYACCSVIVEQYIAESQKLNFSSTAPQQKDMVHVLKLEDKMVSKIKTAGDFSDVKVSLVYYPAKKKSFATLDIVKHSESNRIPTHKASAKGREVAPNKEVNNLLQIWSDYSAQKMRLIRTNKYDFNKNSCPIIHCTWGFDQNDLKNVFPKLQDGVMKHKQALFTIIKNSKNDQARADAIFILANDSNYKELANFLINYTDDSSDLVRNNVMRVLGAIVAKHKIPNLDAKKIIQALNYPYVTDRNKAAYVLHGLIKSDSTIHAEVINQAGNTLIELLKLKQPNNHDYAYDILKEISHENYSELDYQSWSQWINDHRRRQG